MAMNAAAAMARRASGFRALNERASDLTSAMLQKLGRLRAAEPH